MTVVGLHPEELFDKLAEGEISPSDLERLRQHLERCDVCRFEYAARLDFENEAQTLPSAPPTAVPLRPLASSSPELGADALRPRRRGRKRLLMVGLAAAALITASVAMAAVAVGVNGRAPWQTLGALFSEPAPRGRTSAVKTEEAAAPPAIVASSPTLVVEREPMAGAPSASAGASAKPPLAARRAITSAEPLRSGSMTDAAAPASTDAKPVEPATASKLFADANQARRAGDIGRASGLYHLLQDRYAGSPEAELSRVTLALLQLDSGDARAALVGFERYLAGSSRGLEAEALVGRARALGRLGRRDLEMSAWREVQRKFPRSIYGRQATERLSAPGQP